MDFEEALDKGLAAAVDAKANNEKIDAVLKNLIKVLEARFVGRFHLVRVPKEFPRAEQQRKVPVGPLAGIAALSADLTTRWVDTTEAFVLETPQGGRTTLFEIERATSGFPVRISYADVDVYCSDSEALQKRLVLILAEPSTGLKLIEFRKPNDSEHPAK